MTGNSEMVKIVRLPTLGWQPHRMASQIFSKWLVRTIQRWWP